MTKHGPKSGLMPCPFCGGKAEMRRKGTARVSMQIACTNCGGMMESGDVYGMTPPERYSWNRRPYPRKAHDTKRTKALRGKLAIYIMEANPARGVQLAVEIANPEGLVVGGCVLEHFMVQGDRVMVNNCELIMRDYDKPSGAPLYLLQESDDFEPH